MGTTAERMIDPATGRESHSRLIDQRGSNRDPDSSFRISNPTQ